MPRTLPADIKRDSEVYVPRAPGECARIFLLLVFSFAGENFTPRRKRPQTLSSLPFQPAHAAFDGT